jgi:hypothetical protein
MRSPRWIAPIVTWLASAESKGVTGRVFEASGQTLAIAEGWVRGPSTTPVEDPTQIGAACRSCSARRARTPAWTASPGAGPSRASSGLAVGSRSAACGSSAGAPSPREQRRLVRWRSRRRATCAPGFGSCRDGAP